MKSIVILKVVLSCECGTREDFFVQLGKDEKVGACWNCGKESRTMIAKDLSLYDNPRIPR